MGLFYRIAVLKTLVCSDIFGITPELQRLIEQVVSEHWLTVSPYNEQGYFKNEAKAYEAFQGAGGIESYISLISQAISSSQQPVALVGFSAGAAAAYVALNQSNVSAESRLLGFYPGQIRHYLDIYNRYPCTLVFPEFETHFDQQLVCKALTKQPNLEQIHTPYRHGFMNDLSAGFCSDGYASFVKGIKQWLLRGKDKAKWPENPTLQTVEP